jgi:hypothetical protein
MFLGSDPDAGSRDGGNSRGARDTSLPADAVDALARLIDQGDPTIQVVATSSTSVYERVQRGEFPEDLYYRLNVITLKEDLERSVAT